MGQNVACLHVKMVPNYPTNLEADNILQLS